MSAVAVQIADAVLYEISHHVWQQPFVARRRFRIEQRDAALKELLVTVVPPWEISGVTENRYPQDNRSYPLAIVVQKMMAQPDDETATEQECEELCELVEALAIYFDDRHRLVTMPTYWIDDVQIEVLFSPVRLAYDGVFESLIAVTVGNIR